MYCLFMSQRRRGSTQVLSFLSLGLLVPVENYVLPGSSLSLSLATVELGPQMRVMRSASPVGFFLPGTLLRQLKCYSRMSQYLVLGTLFQKSSFLTFSAGFLVFFLLLLLFLCVDLGELPQCPLSIWLADRFLCSSLCSYRGLNVASVNSVYFLSPVLSFYYSNRQQTDVTLFLISRWLSPMVIFDASISLAHVVSLYLPQSVKGLFIIIGLSSARASSYSSQHLCLRQAKGSRLSPRNQLSSAQGANMGSVG